MKFAQQLMVQTVIPTLI